MPGLLRQGPVRRFTSLIAALALGACEVESHALPEPAGEARTLLHRGAERHYYLQNAEAAAAGPAPLVVSLHDFRAPEQALAERGDLGRIRWDALDRVADREGFAVAYPHAWLGLWNMYDGPEADDAGFVFAVVAQLVEAGLADPERVYLTGFADGAVMSFRLLCTAGAPFAAAAAGAGTMFQEHGDTCAAEAPLPVMVIAGTRDEMLPYDGSLSPEGRELSVPETMEHFRRLNGCTGQESALRENRDGWDESRVVEFHWTGCTAGNAVTLLKVRGGGHNWPSFEPIPWEQRDRTGPHNRDIDSAEEIWKFLSRFRKTG